MPSVVTTLPQTHESVTRPVVLDVVRQLQSALRLGSGLEILYPGGIDRVAQDGSLLDGHRKENEFGHVTRIRVEVQERSVEDRIGTIATTADEHRPIFADNVLGVRLRPIYAMTEVQVAFKVRFASKTEAQRFRDDTLLRCDMMRTLIPLQMNYHYSIPDTFLGLLQAVHQLREEQGGYGDTLEQWVATHLDVRATNLTTLIGTNATLAIPEQQIHTWGQFSNFIPSEDPPENEKESGTWVIDFNYRFHYDKPIAIRGEWPISIHNQLLPDPWVYDPNASGTLTDPWIQRHHSSRTREAMDVVAGLYPDPCAEPYIPAIIPRFDDWENRLQHPATVAMMQILIGVSSTDLHDVQDLRDIPDVAIDPQVLEFMKSEASYMGTYGNSIFHLALYEGDVPQADGMLTVSPYLVVRSRNPMDLRKVYHLRVALINDLFMLRGAALQRLSKAGEAGVKILMDLQFRLGDHGLRPRMAGGYVAMDDIKAIAYRLNEKQRHYSHGREALMLTVGQYRIVTHRTSSETDHGSTYEKTSTGASGNAAGDSDGQIVSRCDG